MSAMITAAVVGGGLAIGAASMSSDAAGDAANTAAGAQNNATAEQRRQFDITQKNFEPYKQVGESAAPQFTDFISGKGPDITNDPLYKNAMTAATREATQRAAGSGQSSRSGAVQTRLAQLGANIYDNTWQTKYQTITDALKVGQGAAGSISSAGGLLGNQVQAGAVNLGNIAQNNANTQSSLYGGLAGNLSGIATGALGKLAGGANNNPASGNWWGGGSEQMSGSAGGGYTYNSPSAVGPFME